MPTCVKNPNMSKLSQQTFRENHFYICPASGDYRLIMQGKEPSQLVGLNRQAMAEGKQCLRYVLLTPSPDLNMACDVAGGQILERPLTGSEVIYDPSESLGS